MMQGKKKTLWNNLTDSAMIVEMTQLLERMEQHKILQPDNSTADYSCNQSADTYSCQQKIGFAFLLLVTFNAGFLDSIATYLGSQEIILSLLPTASAWLSITISCTLVAISLALFFSFEAQFLKKLMGVKTLDHSDAHIQQDEELLILCQKIEHRLSALLNDVYDTARLDRYERYLADFSRLRKRLYEKKAKYNHDYQENTSRKWIRYTITGLGSLLVTVGSYYMINQMLSTVASGLLGTPIGWGIIGLAIGTQLILYLSMRGKGLANMMNPGKEKYTLMQEKLVSFKLQTSLDQLLQQKKETLILQSERAMAYGHLAMRQPVAYLRNIKQHYRNSDFGKDTKTDEEKTNEFDQTSHTLGDHSPGYCSEMPGLNVKRKL